MEIGPILLPGLEEAAKALASTLPDRVWFELRIAVRRNGEATEMTVDLHTMEQVK